MASPAVVSLVGANSGASVLDNLTNAPAAVKSALNNVLNARLKPQLASVAAELPMIASLIAQMPPVDIGAASNLSIPDFLKQQLDPMVAKDPAMQKAVDDEITKLSATATIGRLLQLDVTLQSHPLFQAELRKAGIAALLATSPTVGTNQQLQADFIKRYIDSTGSIQDFWQQLSNEPEFAAVVPELQLTLQLGSITLNNVPLVAALRQKYQPKALRDLTPRTAADWTQLITGNDISIPASVAGSNSAEKTANYVAGILRSLQSAFPTDYIAQALVQSPNDIDKQVADFLNKSRDFNLIKTSLHTFLEKEPGTLAALSRGDQNKLIARISGYQRLSRLHSDPQVVTALMGRGLDSAYKISSMPRDAFLHQHTQALGSSANAVAVYETAQRTTAATLNLYTTIREGLSSNHPQVFGEVSQSVSAAVQQIPNWQELFGSTSFCACQDCRSVLSAAAYLADLLHFLTKRHSDPTNPNSPTLLAVLSARRPDLTGIKLNCENTNTSLPYLDLVNEILETVVASKPGSNTNVVPFTVGTAPTISYLEGNAGPVGAAVSIPGGNFGATQGTSTVTFNGTAATVAFWGNNRIGVTVPAGATTGNVVVTVGGVASNGVLFTVGTAPSIELLFSPAGPIGATVVIIGGNFGKTQGTSTVTFSGVPGPISAWTDNGILAVVPSGATTGNVVVTVAGTASNGVLFTLSTLPVISILDPMEGPAGTSVAIVGGNFGATQGTGLVTFNGTPAQVTGWNNIEIVVTVPADATTGGVVVTLDRPSPEPVAYDTPPGVTSDELEVNPEHTNDAAYVPLELSFYPFSLPFDRFLSTARNCLEFGGSSLYEVMHAFQTGLDPAVPGNSGPASSPSDDSIALERLKISASEYLILTGQPFQGTAPTANPADLAKYYGYALSPFNWYSDLALVPTFLQRTGIAYDDLVSLLKTHFLNPSQAMTLQSNNPQDACDIESTTIANLTPTVENNIDYGTLRKIYRFIRLYTKLAWSISDLDKAMAALGATDIDGPFLLNLSQAKQLQDQLNLSRTEIFGLWANLDTDGPDSVYNSLFQNKGTANPVDPAFTLVYTSSTLPSNLNLSFLNPYGARITYSGGQLAFSGTNGQPMTLHQERFLLSLSADANYQRAVQQLYLGNPAPLASLPAGLALPSQLPDAIYYVGNQLFFVGQMADDLQAQLKSLSTDSRYQLAIDNLYDMRWAPGTEVALSNLPIVSHSSTILAALRLTAADLALVLTYLWGPTGMPQLNLANLSALYRYARLARALNLSMQDFITLLELIGISPFPSWSNTEIVVKVPAGATTGNVVVTAGGSASNAVPFTVGTSPQIYSLSPDTGMSGTSVTITGANFGKSQGSSTVTINATPATATRWSDTQITVTVPNLGGPPPPVPAIAVGPDTVPLPLIVTVGGIPSNTMTFRLILTSSPRSPLAVAATPSHAPVLSALSPVAGPAGTVVTITGSNLGMAQGTSSVTFNGTAATPITWSDTQIVATVPIGATTGNVLVTVAGSPTNALSYTVGTAPLISALSPGAGVIGATVTIVGANFGAVQGASTITFNGVAATPVAPESTALFVSKVREALQSKFTVALLNYIYRNISNDAAGPGPQASDLDQLVLSLQSSLLAQSSETGSATDPDGTLLQQNLAKVLSGGDVAQMLGLLAGSSIWTAPLSALPPITFPASLSGLISFDSAAGQLTFKGPMSQAQEVELLGLSNDSSYQSAVSALFEKSSAVWTNVYTSPQSPSPLPAVSFPSGFSGRASNPVLFTVGTAPVVSSVSPSAGSAGVTVTLAGVNYGAAQGASTVTFNGTPATPTSWSNTQIVVPVPNGATTGNVLVTVAGNASNAIPFTITAAPVVFSLSPAAGPVATAVTISGVNFGATQATSTVTLNGTSATPTSWNNTQIVVPVPNGATSGTVLVTVGGNASNAIPFTVTSAPVVFSLSPSAGLAATAVTISGINFGAAQGASTVTFNGTSATPTSWNNTQIVVPVPSGATSGNVLVTVGGVPSNPVFFTLATTPVISAISPVAAPAGAPVTITGSNFGAAQGTSVVTFNGTAAVPTSWNDSQIVVTVPATATNGNLVVTVGALIAFDPTNSMILFAGPMSADQETQLLALSSNTNYQAAIQNLYQQGLPAWSVLYNQSLAALPAIGFPGLSGGSIAFDPTNSELIFTGSMSTADEALLLGLSAASSYRAAILSLYLQPRQFVTSRLFFLDVRTLIAKLIDGPALSQADKYGLVLNALLNAAGSVIEILSGSLTLDTAQTRLLVLGGADSSSSALVASTINPSLAAIADFFAILGNGLYATYYPLANFAGAPPTTRIDPTIDFAWSADFPPAPGLASAAFSAKWTGLLAPQFSETYTLYVRLAMVSSPPSGTVTTIGTAVAWASGALFEPTWAGSMITINGVGYQIQSVAGPRNLTLRNSAGTQPSAVRFSVQPVTLNIGGTSLALTPSPTAGSASGSGAVKTEYTATVDLTAEQLTQVELDYPNITGCTITGLQLSWSSLSTPKSVISQNQLFANGSFTFDQPLATYKLLCRIALLLSTFRTTVDDLSYLSNNPNSFQGVNPNDPSDTVAFDLNRLPSAPSAYSPSLFNQFERLLALFTLRDSLPGGDAGLLAIFEAAQAAAGQPALALVGPIVAATGWDAGNLGVLLGSEGDPLTAGNIGFGLVPGDFIDERWLVRLQAGFALAERFGASATQLFEWASLGSNPWGAATTNGTAVTWSSGALFNANWTPATIFINGLAYSIQSIASATSLTLAATAGIQNAPVPFYVAGFASPWQPGIARDILSTVKARYDDATWIKVGKSLNDKLRVSSRDALVAFILANPGNWAFGVEMKTPDELYEYFLIDVEMGSCMQTSRIVQANAAIQLFVQRCLLNLEPGVSPSAIDSNVWEWMKNYRVWQANREVFLYPENYIDPTLRDDKSEIFRELETELRQGPVTSDSAQKALLNYLLKLDQVARLEICGTYYQFDSNSQVSPNGEIDALNDVLHVFGRTPSTPHTYFYRRLLSASQYGKPDSPYSWTPWEKVNLDIPGDHIIPVVWNGHLHLFWPIFSETSDSTQPALISGPPRKTTRIQLAWSQYQLGKWSAKQVFRDPVVPSFVPANIGTVSTNGTAVTWVSGAPFSAAWVDQNMYINGTKYTISAVQSGTSLTLQSSAPVQSLAEYNVPFANFSPFYSGDVDSTWFTFAYELQTRSSNDLTIRVFLPATVGPALLDPVRTAVAGGYPIITYSPDQPPTLAQFGDPQTSFVEVGDFYISDCSGKTISSSVGPVTPTIIPVTIPLDSVFQGMWMEQIGATGTVTTNGTTVTWSSGVQFSPSWIGAAININGVGYTISGWAGPTSITLTSGAGIQNTPPVNYFLPGFNLLEQPPQTPPAVWTQILGHTPSPFRLLCRELGSSAAPSPSGLGLYLQALQSFFYQDDQRTYFVAPTPQDVLAQPRYLQFSTFWHPHVCMFIETLNKFGASGLLSSVTQGATNDGGIASGFTLSLPNPPSLTALLTPGTLYSEGELYRTPPGTQPVVPAVSYSPQAILSWRLYSNPAGRLYYTRGLPATPGDALVGMALTGSQASIIKVLAPDGGQPTLFEEQYSPTSIVAHPFPEENVDFSYGGAYSSYNWELFFHIPLLVATQLSQNQQFEEAQKWFHYIFNPITNSDDPVPQRFWNFLPFHECSVSDEIDGPIETLLLQLDMPVISYLEPVAGPVATLVMIVGGNFGATQGASTLTFNGTAAAPISWSDTQILVPVPAGATSGNVVVTVGGTPSVGALFTVGPRVENPQPSQCEQDVEFQISQWMQTPFDPFLIARLRTIAFRKTVVMKYLDNLIAWGDYLFSQNTRESINEATQVYVLAQQILGDKPVTVPPQGTIQDFSYNDLLNQARAEGLSDLDDFSNVLIQLESSFPFNKGIMVPRGGAGGTATLNGTAAQNFYFCVPPNSQLMAYWDTVADRLYKIRHCMNIQGVVEQLPLFAPPINPMLLVRAKAMGVDLGSVLNDLNAPTPNYRFSFMFQKAMELCSEVRALGAALLSALEKNDAEGLAVLRATQESNLLKAVLDMKRSQVEEANDNLAGLQTSLAITTLRQKYYQGLLAAALSSFERTQLSELAQAQQFQQISQALDLESGIAALVPNVTIGIEGELSSPVSTVTFGGIDLQAALTAMSRAMNMLSAFHSYCANLSAIMGGWDRRAQDWNFQLQTSTKELDQIQSQINAATVRVQIAQDDLQNQQLQIDNSQAILDFLSGKYTNQELYGWMTSQVSAVYFQCYQMAYGMAKRAESCFQFELGLATSDFIQFGYWDSLRKGLLAGERLYSDLKRMEMAYIDQNNREYEITKYVSLVLFDPLALICLKETGQCVVSLPEALFDMDYPGHYMRRIKSVSLTIPCVTGPYTSVNCKLTLTGSQIRVDNIANSQQDYGQDSHFISNFAATQSIATSSAQNDSGMFELNFRDERYLPFEGAGVISQWLIELPKDCNAFDFETISDVVINLRYTARDGGDALRTVAKQNATLPGPTDQSAVSASSAAFPNQDNLVRFFSLRHEFPTEWYKFLHPLATDIAQSMMLALTKERFPFQYRGKKISLSQIELLLKFKDIHDKSRFRTGTPLGDFVAGQGSPGCLNVYMTPAAFAVGQQPQAPPPPPQSVRPITLTSTPVNFNGTPYGTSPVLFDAGYFWLQVFAAKLGAIPGTLLDSNNHLVPDFIEDIFMACHYSIA